MPKSSVLQVDLLKEYGGKGELQREPTRVTPSTPVAEYEEAISPNLDDIIFNASQPRNRLPRELIELSSESAYTPVRVVSAWAQRDQVSRDQLLALVTQEAKGDSSSDEQSGESPIVTALPKSVVGLVPLARSILANGLIETPNVIRQSTGRYLIETGERRIAACALLQWLGLRDFEKILCKLVTPGARTLARQIAENHEREALTGLEYARALITRRYELTQGRDSRINWNTFDMVQMDADETLAPWKLVDAEFNISSRFRRYVVSLLRQPREILNHMDALGLSERAARRIHQACTQAQAGQVLGRVHSAAVRGEAITSQLIDLAILQVKSGDNEARKPAKQNRAKGSELAKVVMAVKTTAKALASLKPADVQLVGERLARDAQYVASRHAIEALLQHSAKRGVKSR